MKKQRINWNKEMCICLCEGYKLHFNEETKSFSNHWTEIKKMYQKEFKEIEPSAIRKQAIDLGLLKCKTLNEVDEIIQKIEENSFTKKSEELMENKIAKAMKGKEEKRLKRSFQDVASGLETNLTSTFLTSSSKSSIPFQQQVNIGITLVPWVFTLKDDPSRICLFFYLVNGAKFNFKFTEDSIFIQTVYSPLPEIMKKSVFETYIENSGMNKEDCVISHEDLENSFFHPNESISEIPLGFKINPDRCKLIENEFTIGVILERKYKEPIPTGVQFYPTIVEKKRRTSLDMIFPNLKTEMKENSEMKEETSQ